MFGRMRIFTTFNVMRTHGAMRSSNLVTKCQSPIISHQQSVINNKPPSTYYYHLTGTIHHPPQTTNNRTLCLLKIPYVVYTTNVRMLFDQPTLVPKYLASMFTASNDKPQKFLEKNEINRMMTSKKITTLPRESEKH